MAYGFRDEREIARDLVIVLKHERFADKRPIEGLRELKARRLRGAE